MLTMYNAGIIGNFGVQHLLAQNLTLHANYYRRDNVPAFSAKDFAPDLWNFVEPPKTKEEEKDLVNQRLALFGGIPPTMMLQIIQGKVNGN